ncbi:MAG TPA: heme-binding beta-barrel domain-containing protein [Candidatus Limnocylindria bacterium]
MHEDLRPLEWLVGTWEGTATGEPGTGTQTRRYEVVLGGRFILGTNTTRWAATPSHPEGELHEDLSLIGYDRAAKRFVMHVFYVEGFVAEHVGERVDADTWMFTAARVQNAPAGMRSREILVHRGDELLPRFELSMPGKEFAPYTSERLRRVR